MATSGPRQKCDSEDHHRRVADAPPDPLFARAQDNQAGTVAENDKARASDVDFHAVIDRIKAAFARRAGGALTVTIEPVRRMSDLLLEMRASARRQQIGNLGKGAYWENVVYVVQDAHSTPEEVEKTIFHELYGHAATATLFGGEWWTSRTRC
jgi:hypothetical protein